MSARCLECQGDERASRGKRRHEVKCVVDAHGLINEIPNVPICCLAGTTVKGTGLGYQGGYPVELDCVGGVWCASVHVRRKCAQRVCENVNITSPLRKYCMRQTLSCGESARALNDKAEEVCFMKLVSHTEFNFANQCTFLNSLFWVKSRSRGVEFHRFFVVVSL